MKKLLLSFTIAALVVLSGLTIPNMVAAQNLTNSYQPTLGDLNSNPQNDIFASTAVINPGDIWEMNPLWILPVFLIPLGYWYLYKRGLEPDDLKRSKEQEDYQGRTSFASPKFQAYYHDIRRDYAPYDEYNEQLEDITSWYSKKETDKPITGSPKLVP